MSELLPQHEALFVQVKEINAEFEDLARKAKERAFDCGCLLLTAALILKRQGPGAWEDFLKTKGEQYIARTTAFRYIRFASDCMFWAAKNANLRKFLTAEGDDLNLERALHDDKFLDVVRGKIELESAMSFMELLRAVGMFRQREGGGHRSPKSQNGSSPAQQWFSFDVFYDLTWSLKNQKYEALRAVEPERLVQAKTELEAVIAEINKVLSDDPPPEGRAPSSPTTFFAQPHGVNAPVLAR